MVVCSYNNSNYTNALCGKKKKLRIYNVKANGIHSYQCA